MNVKWNYKCHNILTKCICCVERPLLFIRELSWTYAHYRNGNFPYMYPDNPRLYWKQKSFFSCVKNAWANSREYE